MLPNSEALPLSSLLESILFVADAPVSVQQLAKLLQVSTEQIMQAIDELQAALQNRGVRLQWQQDRVQLTTAPASAKLVEAFLGLGATQPLSRAALETLAVIAYRQPVTRPQVDAVRGVNSDAMLKRLQSAGLIDDVGRANGPGRPVLYATSSMFLQVFGLQDLRELPPLPSTPESAPPVSVA
jgi:segregation and condensation protein B